ncbi:MAG: hypothetical protein H7210_03590 [Pyrinomonadaceae bacterium]|nr:hypothetical protein [Phycisphaerales bacterium]
MAKILNETRFSPGPEHANFSWWKRIFLEPGTRLCKFTEHALYPGRGVSPWWALDAAGPSGDPGFTSILEGARRSGRPLTEFFRDVYAVKFEWNSLSLSQNGLLRLQRMKLVEPVYAFHGQVAAVPGKRPPLANPGKDQQRFPGGAFQVVIPGLTSAHMLGTGFNLLS